MWSVEWETRTLLPHHLIELSSSVKQDVARNQSGPFNSTPWLQPWICPTPFLWQLNYANISKWNYTKITPSPSLPPPSIFTIHDHKAKSSRRRKDCRSFSGTENWQYRVEWMGNYFKSALDNNTQGFPSSTQGSSSTRANPTLSRTTSSRSSGTSNRGIMGESN